MQRLWAKIQFVVKGYRNFGQAGFENASKEWDDLEMEYDVRLVFFLLCCVVGLTGVVENALLLLVQIVVLEKKLLWVLQREEARFTCCVGMKSAGTKQRMKSRRKRTQTLCIFIL